MHAPFVSAQYINVITEKQAAKTPPLAARRAPSAADAEAWDWRAGGLVLAGLTDPGNIGTLIRTANAFGLKQVLLLDGVDVYAPKLVQAAAGALADVKVVAATGPDLIEYFKLCEEATKKEIAMVNANVTPTAAGSIAGLGGAGAGADADNGADSGVEASDDDSDANSEGVATMLSSLVGTEPFMLGLVASGGLDLTLIPRTLEEARLKAMLAEKEVEDGDLPAIYHGTGVDIDPALVEYFMSTGRKPWIVIGSEAHGIPGQIEELCQLKATIRMPGEEKYGDGVIVEHSGVGSLNAGVAGSMACFIYQQAMAKKK
jgi:tRNA G18 (ribose-2'-O)-methylase SpoU